MFKKLNKKGFTLAELLIVVAIIAVLVAISIPIFTTQLEKARDAVTVANLRAAYAEAASDALTSSNTSAVGITKDVVYKGAMNEGTTKATAFSGLANELPFTLGDDVMEKDGTPGTYKVKFSFATTGVVTTAIVAG